MREETRPWVILQQVPHTCFLAYSGTSHVCWDIEHLRVFASFVSWNKYTYQQHEIRNRMIIDRFIDRFKQRQQTLQGCASTVEGRKTLGLSGTYPILTILTRLDTRVLYLKSIPDPKSRVDTRVLYLKSIPDPKSIPGIHTWYTVVIPL